MIRMVIIKSNNTSNNNNNSNGDNSIDHGNEHDNDIDFSREPRAFAVGYRFLGVRRLSPEEKQFMQRRNT